MAIDRFKIATALPGDLNLFRQNSNCIKCENTIFCMPDKGDCIYITSASKGRIYIFDIEKREIKMQDFSAIKGGLRTVSVDGERVWLSGYKREIYIWDQSKNEIELLNDFSLNFGIYNFDGKQEQLLV